MSASRKTATGLTDKEQKAADHFLANGSKGDAYRHAYKCSRMKKDTVNSAAYTLFEKKEVKAYILEQQQQMQQETRLTREICMNVLADIILSPRDETIRAGDQIRAIERAAKMLGWDQAEKLDLGGVVFNFGIPEPRK